MQTLGKSSQNTRFSQSVATPSNMSSDSVTTEASIQGVAVDTSATDPESTMIVFDWDDTILPTSWLEKQRALAIGVNRLRAGQLKLLRTLADSAQQTLQLAERLGKVILITNAAPGWIEASCQHFLPSLVPYIRKLPTYAKPFNALMMTWKIEAFRRECGSKNIKTVMSLGDGPVERQMDKRVKSVKFREQPTLQHLLLQHELVQQRLQDMLRHSQDLDLRIQILSTPQAGPLGGQHLAGTRLSCSLVHITKPSVRTAPGVGHNNSTPGLYGLMPPPNRERSVSGPTLGCCDGQVSSHGQHGGSSTMLPRLLPDERHLSRRNTHDGEQGSQNRLTPLQSRRPVSMLNERRDVHRDLRDAKSLTPLGAKYSVLRNVRDRSVGVSGYPGRASLSIDQPMPLINKDSLGQGVGNTPLQRRASRQTPLSSESIRLPHALSNIHTRGPHCPSIVLGVEHDTDSTLHSRIRMRCLLSRGAAEAWRTLPGFLLGRKGEEGSSELMSAAEEQTKHKKYQWNDAKDFFSKLADWAPGSAQKMSYLDMSGGTIYLAAPPSSLSSVPIVPPKMDYLAGSHLPSSEIYLPSSNQPTETQTPLSPASSSVISPCRKLPLPPSSPSTPPSARFLTATAGAALLGGGLGGGGAWLRGGTAEEVKKGVGRGVLGGAVAGLSHSLVFNAVSPWASLSASELSADCASVAAFTASEYVFLRRSCPSGSSADREVQALLVGAAGGLLGSSIVKLTTDQPRRVSCLAGSLVGRQVALRMWERWRGEDQ